jgi:hypothetical protein
VTSARVTVFCPGEAPLQGFAMPLFYFHVDDGSEHNPDGDGVELANLRAAQVEATALAGELLRDRRHESWDLQNWTMSVTDEHGLPLFVIAVEAIAAPAIIHQLRRG